MTNLRTPFYDMHVAAGAKMVPFAGYDMPVQYPAGIMAEHNHTRTAAGLFDVSHMGQIKLIGSQADEGLEEFVPGDIRGLEKGQSRYTLLLNEQGGIMDDLIVSRMGNELLLVVNAGCKQADFEFLKKYVAARVAKEMLDYRALLALQGPQAVAVLSALVPDVAAMKFMSFISTTMGTIPVWITRSGYTGEDGFEISMRQEHAVAVADMLLQNPVVQWIGLGARDSLRLEAGLPLYGHDLDETTTPIEANLKWAVAKRRREEKNFPGSKIILDQLANGAARTRVGIRPLSRAPAREGTKIMQGDQEIGIITSGGFGPSVNAPVAMGYIDTAHSAVDTDISLQVRGQLLPAVVAPLVFVPHNYYRG